MSTSILTSTKKNLGLADDYDVFDADITMFINTAFSTLTQLGVGPELGYQITGATETWDAFYTDPRLNMIQTYVYLRVRMLFDPPQTGYLVESMKAQLQELEWRINAQRETTEWVNPNPTLPADEDLILDGGTP